ncbi:RagB/SusD family nutrient uptake outer membrane protein [Zunongwangia pacifica]|uniref:RagB/SusD family nutrient uptake outer membrane protein n=1 Tax=Zunongwangia pacifica TaxID=2911062 RepID=A0A9X1ZSJ1_9FLAO|nr:RagB/SusD family nutrient uptake outer membrane protein [Zunongwangia pacifica]MCL6217678.1 RagB/SusD family nutrient uptake outer membrane protein [Zunongwangia pacifica]
MKKYLNHKLLLGFLSLLGLSLVSCNEDLEEVPLDFIAATNAFQSPEDIETGIVGLYSLSRDWYSNDSKQSFTYVALGTDEAYFGEDPGGGTLSNWDTDVNPTSDLPVRFWTQAFDLVYQANTVLAGIEKVEFSDESLQNKYIGEARFFRAFAYRILVYMYGDVPLVTQPVTSPKIDFERTPKEEIFTLMEEDLDFAAKNLPTRGNEDQPGRLTQGAAYHLLSETFLGQEKYEEAVKAASHVIQDYGYALMTERFGNQNNYFGGENAYYDLFTMNNHNLDSNTEAIWVIQNDPNIVGGGQYSGERAFGPAYYRMGNTPDGYPALLGDVYNGSYSGYYNALSRPVAWVRPTNYVAYHIWREDWDDGRNTEANIKRHFYFDNPASAFHEMEIDWDLYEERSSPLKDTAQYIYPYFMKVAAPYEHFKDLARGGGGYNHKDLYAFRLAETYLLRAEAYLGLGDYTNAANDINTVRARSNATPVEPAEVDLDYILAERARELYTEEWRMITLMRLGNLVERVRKYNDNPQNPGLGIEDHQNLFPIPQSEIDLNTENSLEQNPGY